MLRKVVVGSGLMVFVPVVKAATPIEEKKSEPINPMVMKPSDLPIYPTQIERNEQIKSQSANGVVDSVRSTLLPPIKTVRQQVETVLQQTNSITSSVTDNIKEFQDRSEWLVKYLREEENKDVRIGAVAIGGLTGFIFGLRGGFIRRILYAGIGSSAMGAVCFPEEMKELTQNNGALAKQYINIAYNFLYGVKPGDPQLEVKFPDLSFPKNFSEFVDMTASVASTVKQAVMPPPSKEEATDKAAEKKQ